MTDWIYDENIELDQYEAFVYLIENLITGQLYIGKKNLWITPFKKPAPGKKRRTRIKKESPWRKYYGSCVELTADVNQFGEKNFKRTILHFCKTKNDAVYLEMKEQVARDVLTATFEDGSYQYYNKNIVQKFYRKD